jgi:hypothetical protein
MRKKLRYSLSRQDDKTVLARFAEGSKLHGVYAFCSLGDSL